MSSASTVVGVPYVTLDLRSRTPPRTPSAFNLETSENVRRTRASKPKVKTGCLTCKIRRVKCDERRPAPCERCELAGRECAGYPLPIVSKKLDDDPAMRLLLRRCPDSHNATEAEGQALQFFYYKTAPQLASYFDAEFWTRLIFQVSHAEGAIKHAMIALGSLARQQGERTERVPYVRAVATKQVLNTPDPNRMDLPLIQTQRDKEENFALMHYNKAITELASRMQHSDVPVEIVLLSCILFVSLEFARGLLQPALKHFKGGMQVALSSMSHKSAISPLAMHRIEENLLPFFNRLELLATFLGNDSDWEYSIPLEDAVPKRFATVRQARDSLVHLMNLAVRFIRANKFRRYLYQVNESDVARQDALLKQLDRWQQTFGSLLLSESITALDLDAAKALRLHHIICVIWTGIALRPDECKCDEWEVHLERAVDLAEAIQSSAGNLENGSSPNFLFDMEIVSPLWFVVVKSRHPVTRRRAIGILRGTTRREGLWDSQVAAVVGERLMVLEEKNLRILDGSALPAECDRIHASHIHSGPVTNSDSQKHIVTYFYKPKGLDEPWESWYEEIHLVRSEQAFDHTELGARYQESLGMET